MNRPPPVEHGIGGVDREARIKIQNMKTEFQRFRSFFMDKMKDVFSRVKRLEAENASLKRQIEQLDGADDYARDHVEYDREGNATYYDDDDYSDYDPTLRDAIASRPR